MTSRLVVISDTQLPYEDVKLVQAVIRFIGEYQPDKVVHIGDLMDYPQPSQWSKDTAAEYQGSVFEDSEYCKKRFFEPLRAVYDGPIGVLEGNHDERPRKYLVRYAPALAESRAFHFENMLDFEGFGVIRLPDFYDVAPGWVFTHGHLAKISLSRVAGNTALNAAKQFGKSVVMGHTHKLGIVSHTTGYNNRVDRVLTGFEVGNLMDMTAASYLKGATANWQQGFGVVHIDDDHVSPQIIAVTGGRFTVDGVVYRV